MYLTAIQLLIAYCISQFCTELFFFLPVSFVGESSGIQLGSIVKVKIYVTVSKLFLAPARYNLIIAWRTVETFHTDTKITCQSVQVLRNMKRYVRTFYWIGIQTGSNRTMFLMSKLLLKNKRKNLSLVQIDLHSPPAPRSAFLVLESLRKHKKRNYFGFACSRVFFLFGFRASTSARASDPLLEPYIWFRNRQQQYKYSYRSRFCRKLCRE